MKRILLFARDLRDLKFEIQNLEFEIPGTSNVEFQPSSLLANSFLISNLPTQNPELSTQNFFARCACRARLASLAPSHRVLIEEC